jgi:hypothetical protein
MIAAQATIAVPAMIAVVIAAADAAAVLEGGVEEAVVATGVIRAEGICHLPNTHRHKASAIPADTTIDGRRVIAVRVPRRQSSHAKMKLFFLASRWPNIADGRSRLR